MNDKTLDQCIEQYREYVDKYCKAIVFHDFIAFCYYEDELHKLLTYALNKYGIDLITL